MVERKTIILNFFHFQVKLREKKTFICLRSKINQNKKKSFFKKTLRLIGREAACLLQEPQSFAEESVF